MERLPQRERGALGANCPMYVQDMTEIIGEGGAASPS
jgi:hypothetical protein